MPIPRPRSPTETPDRSAPLGARETIALALVVVAYLATRLWRLTALPMFFDEATHLLWGERWAGSQGLARALAAGKLLHVATVGIALRLVPDPLWAGRFATVVVGCAGLAGAFALGRRVGGFPAGLQTLALVVACPFLLFHDRMALGDGFVSALTAIALAATVRLCDAARPARGVVLGLALAATGAAKILGLIVWVYPLVAIALLAPRDGRAWRALAVAWGLAGSLLLVPLGVFLARSGEIESKAARVDQDRLALAARNVSLAAEWLWLYCTPGLVIVGLVATIVALARRRPVELLLVFTWTFPLAVFILGAAVWYPRYVVFATVPFLCLAAGLLAEMQSRARGRVARAGALAVTAAVFVPAVAWDARLLREPSSARLPEVDRWQYVEGWPSGYGWRESFELLAREKAASGRPLRVVTDRLHWTLKAYFIGEQSVTVKGFDFDDPSWAKRAGAWVGSGQGWLVTSGPAPPPGLVLQHAAGFKKPGGGMAVNVYRLEVMTAGHAP